jgi:hypothetical protein
VGPLDVPLNSAARQTFHSGRGLKADHHSPPRDDLSCTQGPEATRVEFWTESPNWSAVHMRFTRKIGCRGANTPQSVANMHHKQKLRTIGQSASLLIHTSHFNVD